MARKPLDQKDVRELQHLAQELPIKPRSNRRQSPSRAAMLELIDILSRWSTTGLALIGGLSIYLALTAGRVYPARAACWALLLISALWVCRNLLSQFRSGGTSAGHPFHWRASYTSCLSVLGVVFASAPILLTPVGAPASIFLQVTAIGLVGGFAAAIAHSAHLTTTFAIAVPTAILPLLSAIRAGDTALTTVVGALSAMGLAISYGLCRVIASDAAKRNPRTSLQRRSSADFEEIAHKLPSTSSTARAL